MTIPTIYKKKHQLACEAISLCLSFCQHNKIRIPSFSMLTEENRFYHVNSCGFYRARHGVCVMPDKCSHLGISGGSWSWPGYVIDRTAYGVVCHEMGHYVHEQVLFDSDCCFRHSNESCITSYGTKDHKEWFAEMFRLYLTNPDLLEDIKPKTFEWLDERFHVVESRPWRHVLHDAPERTINAALNKINKARKGK